MVKNVDQEFLAICLRSYLLELVAVYLHVLNRVLLTPNKNTGVLSVVLEDDDWAVEAHLADYIRVFVDFNNVDEGGLPYLNEGGVTVWIVNGVKWLSNQLCKTY